MTVSVFSLSIDVNKALLLLNGILLPDPAINISLALSHLACVLTLCVRERGIIGSHLRTWQNSLEGVFIGQACT